MYSLEIFVRRTVSDNFDNRFMSFFNKTVYPSTRNICILRSNIFYANHTLKIRKKHIPNVSVID